MAEKMSMAFGLRDALAEMQNLEGCLLDTCRSQERVMQASSIKVH